MIERVGVVGAGTMGAGIAQIAALGGFETLLHDPIAEALDARRRAPARDLAKGAERGRWSDGRRRGAAEARLEPAADLADLAGCDLVIEAAPEDLELKRELFARLAEDSAARTRSSPPTPPPCRSPRSPPASPQPERVVGMHFFNPPAADEAGRGRRGDEAARPR